MIDFIPLRIYTLVFCYAVLVLVAISMAECFSGAVFQRPARTFNSVLGTVVALLLTVYIGLRPVNPYYFGDTINYAITFENVAAHGPGFGATGGSEWFFNGAMRWFAAHSDVNMFFLFCAAIYVGALWWALVRIFGSDFFIPFVVAIGMFTFFSYGVNGVRNGMASSLLILALTFRRQWPVAVALAAVAIGTHRSMLLTAGAAGAAMVARNPRIWLWFWVGSIAASLVAGGGIASLVAESGFLDDNRFTNYITGQVENQFSREGFRWDFLLYSAVPVVLGWYFVFRRGYGDRFYVWLWNIYLITNAFWILVIRAGFSNRFAQISWFIMPLVLIYPFFMKRFWADQPQRTGWGVAAFYFYTFFTVFVI